MLSFVFVANVEVADSNPAQFDILFGSQRSVPCAEKVRVWEDKSRASTLLFPIFSFSASSPRVFTQKKVRSR